MRKPAPKKLAVKKETLRTLGVEQLKQVAGGVPTGTATVSQ